MFPALRIATDKVEHEQIHEGLEKLEAYCAKCQSGESELVMKDLLAILDSFGDVLWTHMDAEVESLGAERYVQQAGP
jgi:hypothetical protein